MLEPGQVVDGEHADLLAENRDGAVGAQGDVVVAGRKPEGWRFRLRRLRRLRPLSLADHASGVTDGSTRRAEHIIKAPLRRRRRWHGAASIRVAAGREDPPHAIAIEPSLHEYLSAPREFGGAVCAAAGETTGTRPRRG